MDNDSKKVEHYVGFLTDITDRKAIEDKLVYQATHDPLTGLPNRVLLYDRLQQAMLHAKRHNQIVALLFLDLDKFKSVNDTYGHIVGDKLLTEVASRLSDSLKESDTIARLGGDEFVIIIPELMSEEQAIPVAERVLEALSKPFTIEGHELTVSACIGISCCPKDGSDFDTLANNADACMYKARESGSNNFILYSDEINQKRNHKLNLENSLKDALGNNELELYYQPIFDLKHNRINGFEALIRWNHPNYGYMSPSEFLPLAEESGLIIPIGEWTIKTACEQLKKFGDDNLLMSVNISRRQFRDENLIPHIKKLLIESQLKPSSLALELSEKTLMNDAEKVADMLHMLKETGVKIVIDDFGMGFSSLHYLTEFPIETLKVDKQIIQDLNSDPNHAAVTTAILAMAEKLHLSVSAKGVETEEQVNFLKANNCELMQGYYFNKPLSAADCTKFLKTNHKQ